MIAIIYCSKPILEIYIMTKQKMLYFQLPKNKREKGKSQQIAHQ